MSAEPPTSRISLIALAIVGALCLVGGLIWLLSSAIASVWGWRGACMTVFAVCSVLWFLWAALSLALRRRDPEGPPG